ncbi:MAG: hypothetical protein ACREEB_10280 [Caulobacteraceae bacterium]
MPIRRFAIGVLCAALLASPASAADVGGARKFVAWIYSHYPTSGSGFVALGAAAKTVFHPSLLALIGEDRRLADGEVGALDGDPLCDCQDDGGMTFQIKSVRDDGDERATAVVVRREVEDPAAVDITLDLALSDGHWRVYDIHTKDTPSLRTLLIKSNLAAAKSEAP